MDLGEESATVVSIGKVVMMVGGVSPIGEIPDLKANAQIHARAMRAFDEALDAPTLELTPMKSRQRVMTVAATSTTGRRPKASEV